MKKIAQGFLMILVGIGISGVATVTASANQYSAKRSNSVKLIWRKSMGRHTFTASSGSRYSKHLGTRYSSNSATTNVTWYTDAHQKLYSKTKHTSSIYYHVRSSDGKLGGWIWRGYLKPVKKSNNTGSPVNNTNTLAEKIILGLGHGAKPDPYSMKLANSVLSQATDGQYHFVPTEQLNPNSTDKNNDRIEVSGVNFSKPENSNEVAYRKLLIANNIPTAGMGSNMSTDGLFISSKLNPTRVVDMGFSPLTALYGHNGITSKNYYSNVKIGLAINTLSNGKTAMFIMMRYPSTFTSVTIEDD